MGPLPCDADCSSLRTHFRTQQGSALGGPEPQETRNPLPPLRLQRVLWATARLEGGFESGGDRKRTTVGFSGQSRTSHRLLCRFQCRNRGMPRCACPGGPPGGLPGDPGARSEGGPGASRRRAAARTEERVKGQGPDAHPTAGFRMSAAARRRVYLKRHIETFSVRISMTTVKEIEKAIESLSLAEQLQLYRDIPQLIGREIGRAHV